jgi:hypothetical protein
MEEQTWYGIWIIPHRLWMSDNNGLIVWGPRAAMRAQLAQMAKANERVKLELEVRAIGDVEPSRIISAPVA